MVFYISDPHFGHANIIRLCGRPFNDVDEMDRVLISNWNSRVSNGDDVFILGDLAFRNEKPVEFYLDRLNGKKHLIVGNHDRSWMKEFENNGYFENIDNLLYSVDNGRQVTLCHYPMVSWPHERKSYMIFGHIHNTVGQDYWSVIKNSPRMLNAGADINNFMPVTFEELVVNNARFKSEN